jgi:hypothetical protein
MTKFIGCFILLTSMCAATVTSQEPQPVPEMQSLESALGWKMVHH